MLEVYTDGCCWPNDGTGNGTYGFVITKNDNIVYEHTSSRKLTTNNRMELCGVVSALKYLIENQPDEEVKIFSDSKYVVDGYNKGVFKWIERNKQDVKNNDIWSYLHTLRSDKITLQWIKGHAGFKWNEYVDELCSNQYIESFGQIPKDSKYVMKKIKKRTDKWKKINQPSHPDNPYAGQ